MVTDTAGKAQECIVSLDGQYIFNNYSYDFGRLLKIDAAHYRILWSKQPKVREVLNIETNRITKKLTTEEDSTPAPLLSIVMPTM
ncbi:hypothetical protein AGMMS4957_03690 [Bacteroidia bacterium]|nr:hypothetical protein AGMMS4957_03590 [Bacteroidia bacterium]GHT19435.1 hypothetical protein AGMMS4957_03690 [Bacteroidia bacterium]